MKLLIRSINTPRPPRVWSTDGEVLVSLDTDGTGLVMTPDEARALADKLRAAADQREVA